MGREGQIYIRGYPRDTKQDQLREAFKEFGDITEIKMVTAYSFITYDKPEQAQAAVDKMDGQSFQGSNLVVEIAGVKKNKSGPQPDDICRSCGGKGHWKNSCPDRRSRYRSRRRHSRSSSSESDRRHRRRRDRRRRRRSSSSESSSRSRSSSRSSRSTPKRKDHRKKKDRKERSRSRSARSDGSQSSKGK